MKGWKGVWNSVGEASEVNWDGGFGRKPEENGMWGRWGIKSHEPGGQITQHLEWPGVCTLHEEKWEAFLQGGVI